MAWPSSAQTRLLVVAPHPDDETLAGGVLVQQVLAAGGAVHVLLLTDGDNNPWPQRWLERRWRIGPAERQRWASLRRSELCEAMGVLGLPPHALTAFGWPDQGLTRRLQTSAGESRAAVRAVLDAFEPTVVAMPALEDRHPDHSAAHVVMRLALADLVPAPAMLLYTVHTSAAASAGDIALQADAAQQRRKHQALACHRTQLALSGKRMQRLAARTESYRFQPAAPCDALPWHPPRAVWPWLTLTMVSAEGGRVLSWNPAATAPHDAPTVFAKLQLAWPSLWIFDHWGWCELRR
ncbi:PIG-L family deacetylase [Dyella sp.]|jgi:LmbE family N-acetylglucosaminyl deacetylase|uniref:PIG-L deacetylase family protein n=1 Tax=Dyella sp. TaxID=1869338 RepID=UPI002D79A50C|nr:PIG-L family deacetylase [Dyella sp.]HET6433938.1 PIG-L family deacetylase [Dyella sp.]